MESATCCASAHRRAFLRGSVVAGLGTLSYVVLDPQASASPLAKAQRDALTPDAAIKTLLDGNARFLAGTPRKRDSLADMHSGASGQYPVAVVLSCIDSRVPVELICDQGLGDVFSARIAGDAVNDDVLGSMEYGCEEAGAKAVVVMGHTECGAIKGAIDGAVLGNLTLLLARFKSAIDATQYTGDRTSKNPAFVAAVAATHVTQAVKLVRARSPVLAELEEKKSIKIVGSMYNVGTGKVTML